MTRPNRVVDAEYDEISTVGRPANQYGHIVIAKRANQEDAVPDNEEDMIFDQEGYQLDPEALEIGDVVFDADGSAYEVAEDDDADEYADEDELVGVGKALGGKNFGATAVREGIKRGRKLSAEGFSASRKRGDYWATKQNSNLRGKAGLMVGRHGAVATAGTGVIGAGAAAEHEGRKHFGKSDLFNIQQELSKAITEADQVSVLAKAFESVEKRAEAAESRIHASEAIAKSERELRLTREYISKAAEYNVPISPEQLGPVLMRMAESMDYADCAVIHKALTSSGALLEEIGKAGYADNNDPFAQIDELLGGEVSKAFGGDESVSKAHRITNFFDENPQAFDEYRAERARR